MNRVSANMLHNFDNTESEDSELGSETFSLFMESELNYHTGSESGKKVIAEQYIGLPYEDLAVHKNAIDSVGYG